MPKDKPGDKKNKKELPRTKKHSFNYRTVVELNEVGGRNYEGTDQSTGIVRYMYSVFDDIRHQQLPSSSSSS